MKRILVFSELNFIGAVPREFRNMRTEFAWMCALQAFHYPLREIDRFFTRGVLDEVNIKWPDYVFFILPKKIEGVQFEAINRFINNNDYKFKVGIIQEGPHHYFEDYDSQQIHNILALLFQADLVLVHNLYDLNYYRGLVKTGKVEVIPTLMIEDCLQDIPPAEKIKNTVMIGGNLCGWYGGLKSNMVVYNARLETNVPLTASAFTSGRYKTNEEQLFGVQMMPWASWFDYMKILSKYKYAVHLMPTVAAGTFSLNCAYFGIPCIGNIKVDTQRLCFPDLSVDSEDIVTATKLLVQLIKDENFYQEVSKKAQENYRSNFSEEVFLKHINNILGE